MGVIIQNVTSLKDLGFLQGIGFIQHCAYKSYSSTGGEVFSPPASKMHLNEKYLSKGES